MDTSAFLYYIDNNDKLDETTRDKLEVMVKQYPYFQTAQLLWAKNLYKVDHPSFNAHISDISTICADRSRLFYLINEEKYAIFFQKENSSSHSDRTKSLLDSFLTTLSKKKEESLPEIESAAISSDYLSYVNQETNDELSTGERSQKSKISMKGQSLIDNFLEKAASNDISIQPLSSTPKQTSETEPATEGGGFLTETLARIYIKQKKYEQALAIIRQLSLKFPKKSAYFADQIRFLEYLIINEKNKNK